MYDAYLRSHTIYAVSDRAAYILVDGQFPRTTVFTKNSIAPIELRTGSGSTGSIHFGPRAPQTRNAAWNMWASDTAEFSGIQNVASVYALVKEIA